MAEVSQVIEIKASPLECYEVITNFRNYPEFLKESKEVKIEKKSGNTWVVRFTTEVLKKFSYTLKMTGKAPKILSWELVEGDMMKSNNGSWKLEALDKNSTKATYTIDIKLALFIPGPISKMIVGSNLPAMMAAFKKRIESKKGTNS